MARKIGNPCIRPRWAAEGSWELLQVVGALTHRGAGWLAGPFPRPSRCWCFARPSWRGKRSRDPACTVITIGPPVPISFSALAAGVAVCSCCCDSDSSLSWSLAAFVDCHPFRHPVQGPGRVKARVRRQGRSRRGCEDLVVPCNSVQRSWSRARSAGRG